MWFKGGDNRLVGSDDRGSKECSLLPLLAAATILASKGKTVLQNVPILSDVFHHESSGFVVRNAKVDSDGETHVVEVDATGDITEEAPYKYVSKMHRRLCLGTNPCSCRPCQSFYARGCNIESRPIDLHLKGLEAMGGKYYPDSWLHRSQGRTPAWRLYLHGLP